MGGKKDNHKIKYLMNLKHKLFRFGRYNLIQQNIQNVIDSRYNYVVKNINKALSNEKINNSPKNLEKSDNPADYVAKLETDEEVAAYYNVAKPKKDDKFQERVVQIRRVTKVVKGGKQLGFRAVVVIGNERGKVGVGVATAKEVIGAVTKAVSDAKRNIVTVALTRNLSIPYRVESQIGASRVILRPASKGTGVVAGGSTRIVLELAGLRNIFGKQLGADSPLNNSRATISGLKHLCTIHEVAKKRGVKIDDILVKNN